MAYGAEFLNANNKVQLSTDATNYYMVQKGSITPATTGTRFVLIAPSVAFDILAVRCATGVVPVGAFSATQAAGTSVKIARALGTLDTIYWYAFRSYRALPPATSGWGMEIYNADGTVAFSTQQPYLVKGFKLACTQKAAANTAVDAGKTFAFISYGTCRDNNPYTEPMGGGSWQSTTMMTARHVSGTITLACGLTYRGAVFTGATLYAGGVFALDVTNY